MFRGAGGDEDQTKSAVTLPRGSLPAPLPDFCNSGSFLKCCLRFYCILRAVFCRLQDCTSAFCYRIASHPACAAVPPCRCASVLPPGSGDRECRCPPDTAQTTFYAWRSLPAAHSSIRCRYPSESLGSETESMWLASFRKSSEL